MHRVTELVTPHTTRWGSRDPEAPLVVLFADCDPHGNPPGKEMAAFARYLPDGACYASVRPPTGWLGDPAQTLAWFHGWLDEQRPAPAPVVLVGFGGGAAFAGGQLLADPARFAAAALLYGTLPFDAGLPMTRGRLFGVPVFLAHGVHDMVVPVELQRRTWDYLVQKSGSPVWAQREPGGHELTTKTVSGLAGWIEARLGFLQRQGTPVGDPPAGPACWPILPDGRLPVRHGEPPEVSVTTPQQQESQNAPAELQEALFSRILQVDGVVTAPSAVSVPGARAFVLGPGDARGPREAFIAADLGEFAHLHPEYDGSLHLVLPITLARDVVVKGWGVPHPLAGLRLSPGMVMIFGPRDVAELEIVTAIVRASHAHAAGGRAGGPSSVRING